MAKPMQIDSHTTFGQPQSVEAFEIELLAGSWHEATWLDPVLNRVTGRVRSMCTGCAPLEQEIAHATAASGKRIRAGLLLSWCAVTSGDTDLDETAERAAAAIELIHEASLIHDDVCDSSFSRRGRRSVAARFDVRRAALAGAAMAGRGVAELAAVCEGKRIRLDLEDLRDLTEGQIFESLATRTPRFAGMHPYWKIVHSKTGSLFRFACHLGARLGVRHGDGFDLKAPLLFADCLAAAFQVLDDVLDIEADPVLKPGRSDIARGIPTWPILEWIVSAPSPQKAWELLRQPHKSSLQIQQLYSEIVGSGSIKKARSLVRVQLEKAREILSAYHSGEAIEGLNQLLSFLAMR
jgi:geranylgeranyl pyrophosphate synthase